MTRIFKNCSTIFLISIVLLAFLLRFYKVSEYPPSLNWDEVSIGYNAYSVLKTGKDEWGKFLPVHFKSYGEYKLPVQIYASIPAIWAFGLNDFGVRLTPVIYGTLTVLLLFFLSNQIFKNKKIGLIASFLLAISPWHIQLTRASFESSFSVFWVVLGIYAFLKGLEKPKVWLASSAVFFALAIYTYNSARVFTPLFLAFLVIAYRKNLLESKKGLCIFLGLFALMMIPLIPFVLSGEGAARYRLVSVVNDKGLIPRINENRGLSKLPQPLPKLLHNKLTYLTTYYSGNYLAHFSPDFLFFSGAPHKQHHVQGVGEMYAFQLPLLFAGLYFLFRRKLPFRWVLIAWILISIIPVATTNDSIPHALRTLIAAPPYQLICAYGAYILFDKFKSLHLRIGVLVVSAAVALASLSLYSNNFYISYPQLYSRDWQYGNKQVVRYIKDRYNEYDLIVYSRAYGEPHMFTLFYLNYDPAKYQNNPNLIRFETHNWVWVLKFDKFYFPNLGDKGTQYADIVKKYRGKKILFVGKPGDFPEEKVKLKRIDFLNGNPAFEIVESYEI